jgi:hypothetical protein
MLPFAWRQSGIRTMWRLTRTACPRALSPSERLIESTQECPPRAKGDGVGVVDELAEAWVDAVDED